MFLHHHLYASLPNSLEEFAGDVAEVAGKGGWWDTKYIAEFGEAEGTKGRGMGGGDVASRWEREESSFLGYLFRKAPDDPPFCTQYVHHGFCKDGPACTRTHDLDVAMDWDEERGKVPRLEGLTVVGTANGNGHPAVTTEGGKRAREPEVAGSDSKRAKTATGPDRTEVALAHTLSSYPATTTTTLAPPPRVHPTSAHSAALDSYMTAFVFAFQRLLHAHSPSAPFAAWDPATPPPGWPAYRNRIYLSGKDQPLALRRGAMAKSGEGHREKWKTWGGWVMGTGDS
ncbi:Target of EGR1, member 1 (Nuclear) [Gonapodya sp. JEL0774]|nr:Target of EGR1, member 1 (Nuclear) [Gonapodya sp. JEL0774]